jgi:hypothetical protein
MNQNTVKLLLNVLSSPTAGLSVSQMMGILELLEIVKKPEALKAMQFAASLPSAAAPATLLGLLGTLQGLVKLNPESKQTDYAKLEAYIEQVSAAGADVSLTYGTLLQLLASLPVASPTPTAQPAAARRATPERRQTRERKQETA